MKDRELQCVIDALKTCGHYDKIVALPDAIGDLKELTDLNVGWNQLTALPDTLGALTGLTELDALSLIHI